MFTATENQNAVITHFFHAVREESNHLVLSENFQSVLLAEGILSATDLRKHLHNGHLITVLCKEFRDIQRHGTASRQENLLPGDVCFLIQVFQKPIHIRHPSVGGIQTFLQTGDSGMEGFGANTPHHQIWLEGTD